MAILFMISRKHMSMHPHKITSEYIAVLFARFHSAWV